VLIGETNLASFVDTTAAGGLTYAYNVVAAGIGNCVSPPSLCVEATTTGECTEPPTFAGLDQVTNAAASNCSLTVDWQPPDQVWCGGPVSYNVYRSTTSGFNPSMSNRIATNVSATSFSDQDVISGEIYNYIVRAVDQANGVEDPNINEAAGSPTGPAVIGTWTDDAGDTSAAKLITSNPWSILQGGGATGAGYATGAYDPNTCAALTSAELLLDASPQLTFQSKFDIEDDWDKGELQISTDGGGSWARVPMIYPGASTHTNDACGLGTGDFFTGLQSVFTTYSADLSTWAGQGIKLRWLFSSDGAVEETGWWIDNISITDVAVPSACNSTEGIFSDGFESGDTWAWSN
jgi:bacillopeptidase F (M6 metalloprotease family)